MPNYAVAIIIGHLGSDPQTRQVPNGDSVTSVSVATSRKRGGNETTTWWRGTVWGKRGEALAQHLHKGDPIRLTGEPYQRDWVDQIGNKRTSLEIAVSDWGFVGGRQDAGSDERGATSGATAAPMRSQAQASDLPLDDEIPF